MDNSTFTDLIFKVVQKELEYTSYRNTWLINVTDQDGVIQSYYASTGTAVFRDGNNKYTSAKHTERNFSFDRFLDLCSGKEDIIETFFNN